jgi:predicted ATPase/class 3 adenylate cyclase/DNA-binding CsgD family transcriptional regulator
VTQVVSDSSSGRLARPLIWGSLVNRGSSQEMRVQLPAGTVTFLLSDIEGSTRLWEADSEAMSVAVARSYVLLAEAIGRHGGVRPVEQGEGDSVVAAFARASEALAAALDAQAALHAEVWSTDPPLRVRIALHTAEAQLRDEGNYFGQAVNRCARLRAVAHGGQTLLSRATHDLVVDRLADGVGLVDLGMHRLRDLGRPEQIFAATREDVPAIAARLRSLESLPNNLPGQLTSFVGRERELDDVRGALATTRLLTLTGAGGCGKTRLALQATADSLERWPDGAWWIELAPLTEDALIGSALAGVLGAPEVPGRNALEAAVDHLAGDRALVVLDNCEHLLEAAAGVAESLLQGCPEVTVLATSRVPLGVGGEAHWRVPSLSLPAERGSAPVEALTQYDAVRLFIERAVKVRPNFAVTNANAPAVAQICRDLDGIPLAIELAAARVRMLSPGQIAAGLDDRFRLLTGGARSAMPRQQTLRASVDWSHALLSDKERLLFRRLAVFAGGFTLEAVEQVCGDRDLDAYAILDLLTSLVDKSLVLADEGHPAMRYRMLATVREYALDILRVSGEHDALRERHRDYFLALAEQIEPELVTINQRQALGMLDPEAANLAVAIDRAAQTDPVSALRLCAAMTFWWKLRGRFAAAELAYGHALNAGDPAPSSLRARVLWGRAYLLTYAGDYETGIAVAQDALALAEAVADSSGVARVLDLLGTLQVFTDPVGSRAGLARSIELARETGDEWCLVDATQILGYSYLLCNDIAESERLLNEVLPIIEQHGYGEQAAWHWLGMSFKHLVRAEPDRFHDLALRTLTAAEDVGEPVTAAFAHAYLTLLEIAQGRPEAALVRIQESEARVLASGGGMALAFTQTQLACARAALGELAPARAILEAVVASGADYGYALATALVALGDVLRAQDEADGAEQRAREALEISERVGSPALAASSRVLLGRLAAGRGDWSQAETLLHEALAPQAELQLRLWLPQTLEALAEIAAGLESSEEAARLLGAAQRARSDLGIVRWPPDEPRIHAFADAARAQMGDEAFAAAQADGASLSLDEAIAWIQRARGSRKRPSGGWESLTPTEIRVTELVTQGLTNPQIGERMFISRATVKVHLAHIFQKLDVRSRSELTAQAVRRGG